MTTSLQKAINLQRGIFARHQAIAAGCTPKEFRWLTRRDGVWIRIRYGVYAKRTDWEALPVAKQEALLDRAALLVCDSGTVLSHSSAARLHGLPLYDVHDQLRHVTRLRTNDRRLTRTVAGIKHHCGALTDEDITSVDGLPVTSVARTVLDIASEFGYRTGLVTADAALAARLVTREELALAMRRFVHDSHARTRAAVVADADGRAESPLETLSRILLKDIGIIDVEPRYEIRLANEGTVFVDLYSSELHHCFECDGKLKYREQVNLHGVPVKADDVVWDEKQREDKIRGAGFGVSRLVWKDTMPKAFAAAESRIWREIRLQDAARRRSRTEQPA